MCLLTICSRWVTDYISMPVIITKLATIATYAPFLCFVLWKFFGDLRKPEKSLLNLTFYVFSAYYAALFVFRFFTGAEIKENLYYTAIFLGSLALFMLIANNNIKITAEGISKKILLFSSVLLLYYFAYFIFIKRILYSCPINEIALGGTLILLLPVISAVISKFNNKKMWLICSTAIIAGIVLTIMTLGSRAVFAFMCIAIIAIVLININNKKLVICVITGAVTGIIITAILFAFNISSVRTAVYRETNLSSLAGFIDNIAEENTTITEESTTVEESTTAEESSTVEVPATEATSFAEDTTNSEETSVIEQENSTSAPINSMVDNQIAKSDSMRSELFKLSIEEVKKNILFGTGNVFYEHEYSGSSGKVNAPVHNILLATLNCYGLLGLILIAAIIILICIKFRILNFRAGKIQFKLTLLVLFTLYFGISMIQATGYDTLVMPVFFIGLGVFWKLSDDCILMKE